MKHTYVSSANLRVQSAVDAQTWPMSAKQEFLSSREAYAAWGESLTIIGPYPSVVDATNASILRGSQSFGIGWKLTPIS